MHWRQAWRTPQQIRPRPGRTRRPRTDGGDPHEREDLATGQDAADQAVVVVIVEGWGGGGLERLERHRKDLEWAVIGADRRLGV